MSTKNNKRRDRNRKPNERRDERRPSLSPNPRRQKRWKDMYESGALGDDVFPDDGEEFSLFDDDEEDEDNR